ncbi:MAG: sodium:calcium antiporter [Deltaproteobacteria bacterium]|nr:MAG: sodium:calcium antiporter [Deltaproteobacteria bacterium]
MDIALVIVGFLSLLAGGELLVRGATQLARLFGMSPLLIGLTVVACGTSAPELAASLSAAFQGVPEVALGNVLGSNTANVGLILGIAALIRPVGATPGLFRRELPLMIFVVALPIALYWNGYQGRIESAALLLLLGSYLSVLIREARRNRNGGIELDGIEDLPPPAPLWMALLTAVAGGLVLAGGAWMLVRGAVNIAAALGVPDRVIGLTLVALGTSLPELAASAVAAYRGHSAMVLGNVIGSNIFNVLAILGATGLVKPLVVDPVASQGDELVAVGFTLLLLPFLAIFKEVGRLPGLLLVFLYGCYVFFLFGGRFGAA